MDTLFISDIPKDYHFAVYGSNYIDLYNTPNLVGTLEFYRVYLYDNIFLYEKRSQNYNQYYTGTATPITVSDNALYRRDFPNILIMTFRFCYIWSFLT